MALSEWWNTLTLIQKVYWWIAIPSTLIFTIQLIISIVGIGGDDMDLDSDTDLDVGDHGGMNIFSVRTILSFLMFFSWTGIIAIDKGMTAWWAISLISFCVGSIMMLLTAWIFWTLLKLQYSGNVKIHDAIGETAEVYLTIPAKKSAPGKIQVALSGGLRTLDAVTEDLEDIKSGSFVEVIDIVNDILVVTRKR